MKLLEIFTNLAMELGAQGIPLPKEIVLDIDTFDKLLFEHFSHIRYDASAQLAKEITLNTVMGSILFTRST
jgi:hypothetical protein